MADCIINIMNFLILGIRNQENSPIIPEKAQLSELYIKLFKVTEGLL